MFFNIRRDEHPVYGKLESDDCETLIPSSETVSATSPKEKQSLRAYLPWATQLLCLPLAVLFGVWLGHRWNGLTDRDVILQVSQNSPVLEDVDISFNVIRFNGTFMNENIFRQDASPEVDAAWASMGIDYRALAVPEHLAEKAGLAPDQVKISQKYGGGYPANVEGLHHLHCLNLLRKTLYYNYDYYHALGEGAFKNDDFVVRKHVSHCLDIIRQQLMCTVDIGVLGQVWWDDSREDEPPAPKAFTDFNTNHKCRNYDAIREWAEKRQLPKDVPPDFLELPKPGDRVYPGIP